MSISSVPGTSAATSALQLQKQQATKPVQPSESQEPARAATPAAQPTKIHHHHKAGGKPSPTAAATPTAASGSKSTGLLSAVA